MGRADFKSIQTSASYMSDVLPSYIDFSCIQVVISLSTLTQLPTLIMCVRSKFQGGNIQIMKPHIFSLLSLFLFFPNTNLQILEPDPYSGEPLDKIHSL